MSDQNAPSRPLDLAASHFHDEDSAEYFTAQKASTDEWWARMGVDIDLMGKSVLDFGCGHGQLSLSCLERGAARVVGIDLDEQRIAFATAVTAHHPSARGKAEFHYIDVAEYGPDTQFDVIVSKDTFEHIIELEMVLMHLHRLLKPGGVLLAGFAPLFYSPFGDHGRLWLRFPWTSALIPEPILVHLASRRQKRRIRSIAEVGLNKLTPRQFREAVARGGWVKPQIVYNRGDKMLLPLLNKLRKLSPLEKYFTVSIYAHISKNES